jgi:hypothetical protein
LRQRSGGLFLLGHRDCPPTADEITRATAGDELESAVATTRQEDGTWQVLYNIYGWFTEGFDAKDLQEAKVLLEGLA